MIEPKEVEIDGKNYTISKFNCIEGREIVAKYTITSIPKLAQYLENEEVMYKLLKHVAVSTSGGLIKLSNRDLIINHIKSWETLVKVEWAVMQYNISFFQNGSLSTLLISISQKLPQWISKMWMDSSAQSSQAVKPPSMN